MFKAKTMSGYRFKHILKVVSELLNNLQETLSIENETMLRNIQYRLFSDGDFLIDDENYDVIFRLIFPLAWKSNSFQKILQTNSCLKIIAFCFVYFLVGKQTHILFHFCFFSQTTSGGARVEFKLLWAERGFLFGNFTTSTKR